LSADTLRDVNANGGPLVMRSSILNVLDAELQSDLIQETTYLHHEDHTETKTKGWTFPWFDDPRPALVRSLDALVHAKFAADSITSGLQTTTNALRLVNDALRLKIDPRRAIPTLACDLANKVASFSYGTTTTKEWVKREIPELNKIEGRVVKIKNKLTHLEGQGHQGADVKVLTIVSHIVPKYSRYSES
jgi:hypothetical protein